MSFNKELTRYMYQLYSSQVQHKAAAEHMHKMGNKLDKSSL